MKTTHKQKPMTSSNLAIEEEKGDAGKYADFSVMEATKKRPFLTPFDLRKAAKKAAAKISDAMIHELDMEVGGMSLFFSQKEAIRKHYDAAKVTPPAPTATTKDDYHAFVVAERCLVVEEQETAYDFVAKQLHGIALKQKPAYQPFSSEEARKHWEDYIFPATILPFLVGCTRVTGGLAGVFVELYNKPPPFSCHINALLLCLLQPDNDYKIFIGRKGWRKSPQGNEGIYWEYG